MGLEIHRFLPPIILQAIDRIQAVLKSNQKYEIGYENEKLVNLIIEKNLIIRSIQETPQVDANFFRTVSAIGLANSNSSNLRVLDFGGGGGHHLVTARLSFPDKSFSWVVVETPALVAAATQRIDDQSLRFIGSIDSLSDQDQFDLVHSNSAIQYTQNPIKTMEELFAINSPLFVLTRVPLSMGKTQIEYIQISNMSQNGPGKAPNNFRDAKIGYSIRIPSKSAVEELLTNLKFKFQFLDEGPWDATKHGSSVKTFTLIARPVPQV
jgi:putative methyltransferase (TIGR04325 family)